MSLILVLTIWQAVSSTLVWICFYAGIRALPGGRTRQSRWIIGSAVVASAWLAGVFLLGAAGAFRNDALPPRLPIALAATLLPAGIGDVATGLLAPFAAYAWYNAKPYARGAAIAWNVFGIADLINAVALGTLTDGGGAASSSRSCSSRPTACLAPSSCTRIH
jgi:hypothetical protein